MIQGDLFGRCPTKTEPDTGEASRDPDHWVFYVVFFKLVTTFIIDVINIHNQIRCDTSCPLQSYTSNDLIVSKFERLAQRFPQTAKLVEVRFKRKQHHCFPGRSVNPGPAHRWPPDQRQCPTGERALETHGGSSMRKHMIDNCN